MTAAGTAPTGTATLDVDPYCQVFFDDPYPTYVRMQDEAPVSHSPH